MKKIILGFFMLLLPFLSHAQLPTNEGFESATFPPTAPGNWITMDNGVGTGVSWSETTDLLRVNSGLKAAIMDREAIGAGNTSVDWLVTPQITVGANSQLRFFTRQTLIGNNGSTYEIRVSTNASQTLQSAYTTVQTWTETTLNVAYNIYEEKTVSLSSYPTGTQLYIAFVKVNNQPSTATTGDRWLVDDVKVVTQCLDPTVLNVGVINPTSAVLTWIANGTPLNYELEVLPAANIPTGIATLTGATNNFLYTGLTPGTAYKYYVRANCGLGNFSAWVGPFNFLTTPFGSICSSPINIAALPFSQTSNTNLYGDEVDVIQGVGLCGAVPTTTNYQAGAEVFYSYIPTTSGNITITMNPTGVSSSLFVYNGCGTYPGTCIAGVANAAATPRTVTSLAVIAGQTYIIVISSSTTPAAGIPYTLIIQDVNCATPVGQPVTSITTTGANLSWTNPGAATSWQVSVQPAGSAIPTGAGVTANTNVNWAITPALTAATAYQYWVRADCGGGLFSAWAGPYLFNTEICNASDKCNYTFRITDTFGDGWNGALMEVRQNGVVVATLGPQMAATGPTASLVNVTVPLCQTLPFELYWTNGGGFPNEVGVVVINNAPFLQTLYTKLPATGSPSPTTPLFGPTIFNCSQPACLPPTALTTTALTTVGATIGWSAVGATAWDIYVVPTGSPAPTATTVPTFTNVTTNPFVINTLFPNTAYQYYIRTICIASNSAWTAATAFTTLPTCSIPTLPTVTGVTQFSAILNWTQPVNPPPGGGTASVWDIFVLPCGDPAPTAASVPTVTVFSKPYTITGLFPLTCYNFYVRAKCSPTDISPTTTVVIFNTPDINDECANAKLIPVNQNTNCLQTTLGSVAGATASPETNVGAGCSTTADNDDVWFKFVATDTTHYIALLGVNYAANPFGLSFAFYNGNCGALTQIGACVTAATTSHTRTGLVPGQTYYIRVYSTATTASTQQFEICVGTKAVVCNTSLPLCAVTPIILPNNVGVPTLPNPVAPFSTTSTTVGCLGSAPAPTFYYLQLPVAGTYNFFLEQNTNNTFTGTGIDVDFAAWGPYASTTAACGAISTGNAAPTGPTCSFSVAFTENLTINGGLPGQVYVLMITNFSQRKGFIRITQTTGPIPSSCCPYTNFSYSSTAFCKDGVNPLPTAQYGGTLGVFSSTAGLVIDSVTGLINLATSNVGTYVVKNTIAANGGCTFQESTWSVTISNPANATIAYPAPSAFCKNNTTPQAVTQTGTTGGSYSATPAGLTINLTTGVIIPNTSAVGTYTVNYSINTVLGCPTFIAPTTVTITALPIGTFNYGTSPYCQNGGTASPVFTGGGVAGIFTSTTGLVINSITGVVDLTVSSPGTYTVTNTIASTGGCTPAPATNTITITTLPIATFNYASSTYCQNGGIILPTLIGGGFAGAFTSTTGLVLNGTNGAVDLAASTPGTYTVTNTIVAANGCPSVSETANITINANPSATLLSSDADNIICSNDVATITVIPTNFVATAATYVWTLNGNPIAGTTNVISPTASGTYIATVTLNGCINTIVLSMSYTVNALPVYTLTGTNLVKCLNENAVLTVNPTNFAIADPGITYSWTLDGVPVSPTNTTSTLTSSAYGVYEVTVANFGCITKRTITVGLDTADIPINANGECTGNSYLITASPVSSSYDPATVTYQWTNASGTVVGTNQNVFNVTQYVVANNIPSASFPLTFNVKITTVPDGCTDDKSFEVLTSVCVIQKGLSPNGDGQNDFFDLRGLSVKELSIFNRYGTKLYSKANYTNEWRGQNSKSEDSPVGTYYYVIELNSGETKTGWIYINR